MDHRGEATRMSSAGGVLGTALEGSGNACVESRPALDFCE